MTDSLHSIIHGSDVLHTCTQQTVLDAIWNSFLRWAPQG